MKSLSYLFLFDFILIKTLRGMYRITLSPTSHVPIKTPTKEFRKIPNNIVLEDENESEYKEEVVDPMEIKRTIGK